jgi:eukaryotic-like serine/threonine-protein kinase
MKLATGTRFGPYELLSPLGVGGMGEVYRARDTRLDRIVVIKVLPQHLSFDPQRRQRLEREARAVSALSHPHICVLYDIGQQDGIDYLVMEYIEGSSLADRLVKGPLPLDQALRYSIEIADALDKAHRTGIIHRDLKPGNIMITNSGAKLLDFGLAKMRANDSQAVLSAQSNVPTERILTGEGTIVGTFEYMAPEQLEAGQVDARTDIFAFGAVLYQMVTGRKAFTGKSRASLITAIMSSEPPPISTIQPMTPPALDRVVKTCLAKEPDDRWQTAHDLMLELKWIAEAGSQASVAAPIVRRKNRERLAWIAATAILLLALIVALPFVIGYFRSAPPKVSATRLVISASEKQALLGPSISPDGRRLVYAASSDGKQQLWVRSLDSLTAQPLPGTDKIALSFTLTPARPVFWSPDGRYIGFFADSKLKKMEISGGPAQTLADVPTSHGGSWNREGVIVFSPNATSPLYRVSVTGGEATQLTTLDESRQETAHRWPFFLPDGRHFLYLARAVQQKENSAIYVGSLDSKETKRITSADSNVSYAPPGYLLFAREATLMAQPFDADKLEVTGDAFPVVERIRYSWGPGLAEFSVSSDGVLVYITGNPVPSQLTWFDRNGKQLGTVGPPAAYRVIRLSTDEKRVAVERTDPPAVSSDIWLIDLARGVPSRLTSDPGNDLYPVWSPDGSRIAFTSIREGQLKIYQKLSSGAGGEEELLKSAEPLGIWDWSADGRFILYRILGGKTKNDIWVLPMFGDRKPYPLLQTDFNESLAKFSPDGRWVAYVSDETGTSEVYVKEFQRSGGSWRVSTGGGNFPRWRRDGEELFYNSGGKLMAVEVKSSSSGFEPGVPKLLFERSGSGIFDVSGDGQRFLIPILVEESSPEPITVVLNWTADLKR